MLHEFGQREWSYIIARLAVSEGKVLVEAIGQVSDQRLQRIGQHLADWIVGS